MKKYYQECAFPKPVDKKRTKKVNGYKNKQYRRCYFCGRNYAERHELFGGPLRQISIDNGFQVDVCREHHELMHRREGKWDEIVKEMRANCQKEYESKLISSGIRSEQARAVWMRLMGRSFLE